MLTLQNVWRQLRGLQKNCTQRQEWRATTPHVSPQGQQQQTEVDELNGEDGFQPVTRHIMRHQVSRTEREGSLTPTIEKMIANIFSVLLEEEGDQAEGGKGVIPQMDRILSWNVRGMNSPNKQEDIKIFLQQQQAGLVGFLEIKIQAQNIAQVIWRICPNWSWIHNANDTKRGRIIISWHLREYHFNVLQMNDHLIHGEAVQLSITKKFFITFVYERNLEDQRHPFWDNIKAISQSLEGPWSVLGDFNSILH